MANKAIRRQARLLEWPVAKAESFSVGDLLFFDASASTPTVRPLADVTWDTDEETTRRNAISQFVGIAQERRSGKEDHDSTIVVPTACIYELAMTSGTPKIGTLIGPESDGSSALYSGTVQIVSDPADAIGYCVKRYTSATTTVEAMVFSVYDSEMRGLQGLVKQLPFVVANVTSSANILLNHTFGRRVKLLSITTVEATACTGDTVLTLKNGSNSLDDTHTITATAEGTVLSTAISDANDYDIFEHDDQLDITSDAGASGGTIVYGWSDYMPLPAENEF